MKPKVIVHLNQLQLETNLKSLQENVIKYRTYLDACQHITDSREFQTVEQIETYIRSKTSFSNVLLSAGLLDCLDAYKFIQSNYSKINLEVLQIDEDLITTKQSVLDQCKIDATEYLKEDFMTEYNTLLKACFELNKLSNPNSSTFLKRDYNGQYSVNLQQLNNSDRL